MKITVAKLARPGKKGFIGLRCEDSLAQFYALSAAVLDRPVADLIRPALREQRSKLLRSQDGGRLRKELQRLAPELLHGL